MNEFSFDKSKSKNSFDLYRPANNKIKEDISIQDIDIEKPENFNGVRWFKYPSTVYTINGSRYEVLCLRAISQGTKSPLISSPLTIKYENREPFKIMSKNLMKFVVKKGVKKYFAELLKDVPVFGWGMDLYYAIKATVTDISTEETINELTSTTKILTLTEVKFVFVNKEDRPTGDAKLQLVTNKIETIATWDIPIIETKLYSSSIDVIQGRNVLKLEDENYAKSKYNAAKYYHEHRATKRSYVDTDIILYNDIVKKVPTARPRYIWELQ